MTTAILVQLCCYLERIGLVRVKPAEVPTGQERHYHAIDTSKTVHCTYRKKVIISETTSTNPSE